MIGIVAVCGPTAAGKSTLGLELAARFDGEIVSADAFAVYRGFDIGTAKPDAATRARVSHHLIDIADPAVRYSAGSFIRDAEAAIADIDRRGRLAVVVGGTHFYVRALLHGLFPEPARDEGVRGRLETAWVQDPDAVRRRLAEVDPLAAARLAPNDRQRILRALEVAEVAGRAMSELWAAQPVFPARYRCLLLALDPPRDVLHARIQKRVDTMFERGLVTEVAGLLAAGVAADSHAMKAIGYRECVRLLRGEVDEASARGAVVVATRQFAKRQMTWLRHEDGVTTLEWSHRDPVIEAARYLEDFRGTGPGQG